MPKKYLYIIYIILAALVLMVIVYLLYEKRIDELERDILQQPP